jgi:hypothetical protein
MVKSDAHISLLSVPLDPLDFPLSLRFAPGSCRVLQLAAALCQLI